MIFNELGDLILTKVKALDGKVSIYIKFLNTQKEIKFNEKAQLWAASVIKIFIASYFYDQVQNGKLNKDEWLSVKSDNIVHGSGVVHILDPQTKFKKEDLVVLMLALSDNAATNELIDIIGWQEIGEYITKIGLENTTFKHKMEISAGRGPNLTTSSDIAKFLEKIFKNELPYSEKILEIMNEAKDRDKIPLLLPNDIKIPHKYGSLPNAVHDAGIVYAKEPFIFVFLSDDQTDKIKTRTVIAEMAKLCFDYANPA